MNTLKISKETRYGMPAADQILFNRNYVIGYSYYFRQAKWALELLDSGEPGVVRKDRFREDLRIPEKFRADLADYENSGYHRGHLVASANQNDTDIQNSETFLLSNMSPQHPQFNKGEWKQLEERVRKLNDNPKTWETYVISGPIFYFDQPVESIGTKDDNGVSIPIPNAYFKSILTENNGGRIKMWSFILPNKDINDSFENYLVSTELVEKLSGLILWDQLVGAKIDREKKKVREMW